jgi:hypothetical protein
MPTQATKKGENSNGNSSLKGWRGQKEKSYKAEGPAEIETQTKDESGARDGPH